MRQAKRKAGPARCEACGLMLPFFFNMRTRCKDYAACSERQIAKFHSTIVRRRPGDHG